MSRAIAMYVRYKSLNIFLGLSSEKQRDKWTQRTTADVSYFQLNYNAAAAAHFSTLSSSFNTLAYWIDLDSCEFRRILRGKRFRGVWEQRKTEERDFRYFACAENGGRAKNRKME